MEKSFSRENSTIGAHSKSGAISSRPKLDNVERLTTIVNELQQTTSQPSQHNQEMTAKVLDTIKDKIKKNYDNLYDDYDANKKAILKNIQQTENNRAGEDALKNKFDYVLREKNNFDRLKDEVDKKQRKLKKVYYAYMQMMDLRQQLKEQNEGSEELVLVLEDRCSLLNSFEEYKTTLDYESAVLLNMKSDRRKLKLVLKERQQNMLKEELNKKQRIKKLKDAAHTKKAILLRIENKIEEEENSQIPQSLKEQLEKKLEEYEGKYTHLNILKHENMISKRKMEEEKQEFENEQMIMKRNKQIRERQEKKEFQNTYNQYLLKQAEEEKLKKLCGVDMLSQIAEGNFQYDYDQLEKMRFNIEDQISGVKDNIQKLENQIKVLLTSKNNFETGEIHEKEEELEEERVQVRRLKIHSEKKQKKMIEWEGCIQQFLTCDKGNMVKKLKELLPKYQNLSFKQKVEGNEEIKRERKKKFMKLAQSHNLSNSEDTF